VIDPHYLIVARRLVRKRYGDDVRAWVAGSRVDGDVVDLGIDGEKHVSEIVEVVR